MAEVPEPYAVWSPWATALAERLRGLADAEGVLVAAAESSARTHRRRAILPRPGTRRPVVPHVRLTRAEDHLRGEWVGAASFGGWLPMTPAEESAMAALGWHQPARGEAPAYLAWFPDDVPLAPYLPDAEAERAARLVARTMREVFEVDDPADLTIS